MRRKTPRGPPYQAPSPRKRDGKAHTPHLRFDGPPATETTPNTPQLDHQEENPHNPCKPTINHSSPDSCFSPKDTSFMPPIHRPHKQTNQQTRQLVAIGHQSATHQVRGLKRRGENAVCDLHHRCPPSAPPPLLGFPPGHALHCSGPGGWGALEDGVGR